MSSMFTITSVVLLSFYIIENKQMIIHAFSQINSNENVHENKTVDEAVQELETKKDEQTEEKVTLKDKVFIEAPLIKQMPELPRGCEVVSLGMLLAYHNIHIDKMELAKKVKHNPSTYKKVGEKIHFGNPHNGFVGDMYSFEQPGLGVYHKPIAELAEKYAKDMTIYDFTGADFSAIKEQLSLGRPVWVIINSHYKKLPDSEFITWQTEDGPIDITYRLHSVLITGYDENYIYFNDPLNYRSKADIKNFESAWKQMGKQAITIF